MTKTRISLPLLPLRDIVVFPGNVTPLFVGREKSIQALEVAMSGSKEIFLTAQTQPKSNDPTMELLYPKGTIASILQMIRLPDGTVKVLVEGLHRGNILGFKQTEDFFLVEAEVLEDLDAGCTEALRRAVNEAFSVYATLRSISAETQTSLAAVDDFKLADALVTHLPHLKLLDKQKILEQLDPSLRLEKMLEFIEGDLEIGRVEKKIKARVKQQIEKEQKEYYLNEQMAAIQKELGNKDAEISDLEVLMKKKKLSEEAKEKLQKEIQKLKRISPISAEATVVRNYVETILALPWNELTPEKKDIQFAQDVLNADHFGLEKVKDRILEYLSVRTLVDNMKGPILCLVGPPGVGKTSLAKSIAEATGRNFVRISLGGVRDEAEIRGHRRTYVGALPGKILNAIKKAGSINPVVLLDEIDKLSQDFRGDPTAALLEVLDPEQNSTFVDHYLDLDFDLSKVLFVATANSLQSVSRPLLDRMEIIKLVGYTEEEKIVISTKYLVEKQLKSNGLANSKLVFSSGAIRELIRYYTRESGVRSLEREIGSVFRKIARKHLETGIKGTKNLSETVTAKSIQKYLGARRFSIGVTSKHHEIGVCTGLAWTEVGGELLVAEVSIFPGKGKLTSTGKLGEVMQESAKAALSYVRSRSKFLGLEDSFYEKLDIHLHVPEGATPKDGPSAGIAIATALTSALINRPINKYVAMTGEITLRGRVLPIGGLKEKIIAAHRGGITKVLIPMENEKDLEDLPRQIKREITIIPVEHMDQVLLHALVWEDPEDALLEKLRTLNN